jgi:hypothetical protein
MFALILAHRQLLDALGLAVGFLLAAAIVDRALREYRRTDYRALLAALAAMGPRHLLDLTAVHAGELEYEPRHAAPYVGAHEPVQDGAAELGHFVDGDVALIRAYVLLDEPTLAGVGA